ncbi:MAG: hypothetical protein KJ587_15965 [Alphaproteobacteria bacterium]|nr:hypothetical protein [Alphaproteobacteria bacterium]
MKDTRIGAEQSRYGSVFYCYGYGSFGMLYMSAMQRAGIAAVAIAGVWAVIVLAIWN